MLFVIAISSHEVNKLKVWGKDTYFLIISFLLLDKITYYCKNITAIIPNFISYSDFIVHFKQREWLNKVPNVSQIIAFGIFNNTSNLE